MAEMACFSARVCGRVQGVFYRYFVQSMAGGLGLRGYVRNLPGGDAVEVQAEGARQQLEELVERLKVGPSEARVERVEVNWTDYSGQFSDFDIRY